MIVIGAGAAGLAAADALARAGRKVLVLEARNRIGGRCWTRRLAGLAVPVELGAEFVHGRPRATLELLERAGVPGVESTRTQRLLERGRLRQVNAFVEAQKAVQGRSLLKRRDLSFKEFLEKRKNLPPATRALATMMVQGFDAADPRIASARDIADEWADALQASQMRPQGGYGPLLEHLAGNLSIRLNAPVREVRWRRGAVEVGGLRARQAIVTLPLGIMQSGAVKFLPDHGKHAALSALACGPVIRVAMHFREPFWEERCPGVAFFHSPRAAFPTFWTPLPMRAPLLTAWAGGPKAAALTGQPAPALLKQALDTVRSVLGTAPRPLAWIAQDWAADRYARCGYSYVTVGGARARRALRRPLEGTLFFAGEATSDDEGGTVAGALQSGIRAASRCMNE